MWLKSRNFTTWKKLRETNAFIKVSQCGKREILSHWKKFRQINYLLISLALVKPLISRNFCKKSVRENWCNFHTAHCECGKTRHSVPRNFFRQIALQLLQWLFSQGFAMDFRCIIAIPREKIHCNFHENFVKSK